jgi:hypothetical protein
MTFDRFDICEAYAALEYAYNVGGILQERPSNIRRNMSIDYQLHRMGFRAGLMFNGYESLTENGREIYDAAIERWNLEGENDG